MASYVWGIHDLDGNPITTGSWSDPNNWVNLDAPTPEASHPSGPPGAGDTINLEYATLVTMDGASAGDLHAGNTVLVGSFSALKLTGGLLQSGTDQITQFVATRINGADVTTGDIGAAPFNSVIIDAGSLTAQNFNYQGSGSIEVHGGTFNATSFNLQGSISGIPGFEVNGSGQATISGSARLGNLAFFNVGIDSATNSGLRSGGTLNLNGGLTINGSGLGVYTDGTANINGDVIVDDPNGLSMPRGLDVLGAGGLLLVNGDIFLSQSQQANLAITSGGASLVHGTIFDGSTTTGSRAQLLVDGQGSELRAAALTVGGQTPTTTNKNGDPNGSDGLWSYAGGIGTLTLSNGGTLSVDSTISLLGGTITFSKGGSLHLGKSVVTVASPPPTTSAGPSDAMLIDSADQFVGHGFISSSVTGHISIGNSASVPTFSLNIENNGSIEAKDGSLILRANIDGGGTARIDQNSTLEIGGSFGDAQNRSLSKVDFQNEPAGTLIIDDPLDFYGSIVGMSDGSENGISVSLATGAVATPQRLGDKIILHNASLALGDAVVSASLGLQDGHVAIAFSLGTAWGTANTLFASNYISLPDKNADILTRDYVQVSKSQTNPNDTVLQLTPNPAAAAVHAQASPIALAIGAPAAWTNGWTGAGVKIGIISNSFNTLAGLNLDQSIGALPQSGITIHDLPRVQASDEGRDMAQVIHSIAPGAMLDFATSLGTNLLGFPEVNTEASISAAIKQLQQDGCNIIVDDVTVAGGEPAGTLRATIDQEIRLHGITFVTAAGNNGADDKQQHTILAGHRTDPRVISVGAQNWEATPTSVGAYLPNTLEPTSALGADIIAPDGGSTTGPRPIPFFQNEGGSLPHGYNPFFGTSAAAPVVAAVAALMDQASGYQLTDPLLAVLGSTARGGPAILKNLITDLNNVLPSDNLVQADKATSAADAAREFFYIAASHSNAAVTSSTPLSVSIIEALISQPAGSADSGTNLRFVLNVSGPVEIDGSVELSLNDSGTAELDPALSNPALGMLAFNYSVQAGESTSNLTITGIGGSATALQDQNGNAVDLSAIIGASTGISVNSGLVVGTVSVSESGEIQPGDSVQLTLVLSEGVKINPAGGDPSLSLNNGATASYDADASSPAAGKLVFDYKAGLSDADPDLSVFAVELPAGTTVQDASGYNADFSGALNKSLGLQVGPAFVDALATSSGGTAHTGESVQLKLTMSAAMLVNRASGAPSLTLDDGATAFYDAQASNPSGGRLVFDYSVAAKDQTPALAITKFNLNGATAKDVNGVDADFSGAVAIPTYLTINSPLQVSSVSSSLTGTVHWGDTVALTLKMNEPVVLNNLDNFGVLPTLILNDNATAAFDADVSNPSAGSLVFDYVVGLSDQASSLQIVGSSLPGPVLTDGKGNQPDFAAALSIDLGIQVTTSAITVTQALSDYAANRGITGLLVADTSSNVAGGLDNLQSMTSAISLILLSDPAAPTINLSGSQYLADAGVIAKIASGLDLQITLNAGADAIAAPANNPVNATGGHDTILGDGHHNQVTFSLASTAFAIANDNASGVSLTGASSSPTYQLDNVEFLAFTDKTIFIESADSANIARLYSAALGRSPDNSGLAGWEDIYASNISAAVKGQGVYASLAQTNDGFGTSIAGGFAQSPEFLAKYGALNDAGFVNQLYLNVLDRSPSAPELNAWLDLMHNSGFTHDMVLVGFAESPENIAKTGGWLIQV